MSITILGIGTKGLERMDRLSEEKKYPARYIALDANELALENCVSAEKRIKISKRLSASEAADRIFPKLIVVLEEGGFCFILADISPDDEKNVGIIPEIARRFSYSGIIAVGIFTVPSQRKVKRIYKWSKKIY